MALVDMAAIYDPKRGSKKVYVTGDYCEEYSNPLSIYISLPV